MELQSGLRLLFQQYKALFWKNFLLSWRNRRATFLQIFASLFFIFLIFAIQKAIEARFSSSTAYKSVADPEPLLSFPIPPCEDKFYVKLPCLDFVWSGNGSARVSRIVDAIRANNPGRQIPADKVKQFRTADEVDEYLYNNPMTCPGALHFEERNVTVISYGIQTNSTTLAKRGVFEDPTFKFQIPLQIAAEREIARSLIGVPNFSWVATLEEFAHPALEIFSALDTVGPAFFLATAMFGFVFQMSSLITEKELKLRQAMSIMGLYDSAYWLSWLTWEGILALLSSLFIVLFGMMFQFDFFLNNSFAVVFLVFFLFQLNMLGFAFMLSAFITKASSSTTAGFFIFIIGFVTQPNLLAEALTLLAKATSTPQDDDIYKWLVATFFVLFVLAIYFDNIIANISEGGICSCIGSVPPEEVFYPDDEDVLEEESLVKQQTKDGVNDPNIAVQIRGLRKTYPGATNIGCCKCNKNSPYQALTGLWVNFAKDQLFCLLGPNGAGEDHSN
ncbi:ABC transporter A, ABCA [Parasponia andersonii]|uniref:ABC transporter A, ABCA n=1 Tax=Parasponia andersonii TaxID=3476 RepID=A0A2P5A3P2_PARAD|nr:ABC transporter A, ABCA [Parasponia andersonii]